MHTSLKMEYCYESETGEKSCEKCPIPVLKGAFWLVRSRWVSPNLPPFPELTRKTAYVAVRVNNNGGQDLVDKPKL